MLHQEYSAIVDKIQVKIYTQQKDVDRLLPGAKKIFHIIEQDLGRPIAHLKHRLNDVDLSTLIQNVQSENHIFEQEGQTLEGKIFLVRAHPFLSHQNEVSGVALNFVDITEIRETEYQKNRLAAVVTHARDAIILTDLNGNILGWNGGATRDWILSGRSEAGWR